MNDKSILFLKIPNIFAEFKVISSNKDNRQVYLPKMTDVRSYEPVVFIINGFRFVKPPDSAVEELASRSPCLKTSG